MRPVGQLEAMGTAPMMGQASYMDEEIAPILDTPPVVGDPIPEAAPEVAPEPEPAQPEAAPEPPVEAPAQPEASAKKRKTPKK